MTVAHIQPPPTPAKPPRDVRLDVFRGLCLIIIYIAHIWDNPWAAYIPARFGFSDATEIFVFCSGMASAVAFGTVFVKHGFWMGAARVAHRCWQVYWCHIATFLTITGMLIACDRWFATGGSYIRGLGLEPAVTLHAPETLLGLLTLTYVPNFFDILPMYLVVLAMVPFVATAAARDRRLTTLALVSLWALASTHLLDLPGRPWSNETWFFNPFSWQLIFFAGFAFMRGWFPAPPVDTRLIALAAVVVVGSIPLSWWPIVSSVPAVEATYHALGPLIDKTHFGLVRFIHFLSLAYLAFALAGPNGRRLQGPLAELLRKLGQQSLAVFMSGLVLSFAASVVLNVTGRDPLSVAAANLGGIGLLLAIARIVTWFKSSPWQNTRTVLVGGQPLADGRGPSAVRIADAA